MKDEFPTTPERSRMMACIKGKNTKPELRLRSALHHSGLRFRIHRKDLPGTPDLAFVSRKVAVFVDGDFWHGRFYFEQGRIPKSNTGAWIRKFERNRERDLRVDAELEAMGWLPLRYWESDVNSRLPAVVRHARVHVSRRETQ